MLSDDCPILKAALTMNFLALFGIDAQLDKLRKRVGEGALAVEDRVQLVQMELQEEKDRLKLVFTLALALLGLTVVAMTILSLAVVVQFWDSPDRAKAAWMVAGGWLMLWLGAAIGLLVLMRRGQAAFAPSREVLGRDWLAMKTELALSTPARQPKLGKPKHERPVSKQALLDRIAQQRERLAQTPQTNAQAVTVAGSAGAAGAPSPFKSATMRTVHAHPVTSVVVAGAAVATVVALGPKRVLRTVSWLLPLVLPRR